MTRSTSFRISDNVKVALTTRATREGLSTTALLERLIVEGIDVLDYQGIVFRGPAHGRRAALAGGPDVWEVVARLRELPGSEEQRVATLAEETALHPRLIRVALDYAAARADQINERIVRNADAADRSESAVRQRAALLG